MIRYSTHKINLCGVEGIVLIRYLNSVETSLKDEYNSHRGLSIKERWKFPVMLKGRLNAHRQKVKGSNIQIARGNLNAVV